MSEAVMSDWGHAPNTRDAMTAARRTLQAQTAGRYVPARPPAVSASPAAARHHASAKTYLGLLFGLTLAGIAGVFQGNKAFLPEMYDHNGMVAAADAFAKGKNYAVFDLNINIRRLREEHVARLEKTPDVVVFGASHWQEAHKDLVQGMDMYNSHIHRDYWEDMLGITEIWVRNGKLPKRVIISVRDNLFKPIDERTDFLWEPGIPYWRAMADRLGIEKEPLWVSLPYQRLRERLSLSMLFTDVARWYNAKELPHATGEKHFKALDTLLPDGSILWSSEHMAIFTPERSEREAVSFAESKRNSPPVVEERGMAAFKKLIEFIQAQGSTIYFVQPPFNPIYWDRLQGSPYMKGLESYDAMTRELAKSYGIEMIGGFNPHKVGCTAAQYIDAEHANPDCLKNIFEEFTALERARAGS